MCITTFWVQKYLTSTTTVRVLDNSAPAMLFDTRKYSCSVVFWLYINRCTQILLTVNRGISWIQTKVLEIDMNKVLGLFSGASQHPDISDFSTGHGWKASKKYLSQSQCLKWPIPANILPPEDSRAKICLLGMGFPSIFASILRGGKEGDYGHPNW